MPTRKRHHGFTIVELIVTMSILGLMLFLVNQLFNDTSVAVTTSVQTSKTIAASRSINEQLTADMDAMIGPGLTNDGGYIVIIQQRLANVKMIEPQTLTETTANQLRSDQIVFIRDGEGLKSMTPATASSYGSNFAGMPGDRAKVWYGHAMRTLPNGQPRTGTNTNLGEASAKLDRIGSNFILGRQAMLFNPTNSATGNTLSAATAGFTYAANGYYGSNVNGADGYTSPTTYKGLTDITLQDYGPAATAGTLLYQLSDTSTLTVANHTTNYINTSYPVAANRLRVNTAPDVTATNYASWAIAQGHAILAQGCSEIIIDFAADLNGNGRIDRQFGGGTDDRGAIWWYDGLRQSFMGDATNNGTWVQQTGLVQPQVDDSANRQAFIFRVGDDNSFEDAGGTVGTAGTAHSYWPYLIRIRYRLHDSRGRLTGNYNEVNVDNDGDGTVDEAGDDKISGRWFERIIAVPRP
jgi:prepilin-type N-terminal cleavage/methylation domain-containing protein